MCFQTHCHLSINKKLTSQLAVLETNYVPSYGSSLRKDVVNQCLEFAFHHVNMLWQPLPLETGQPGFHATDKQGFECKIQVREWVAVIMQLFTAVHRCWKLSQNLYWWKTCSLIYLHSTHSYNFICTLCVEDIWETCPVCGRMNSFAMFYTWVKQLRFLGN